MSKKIFLSALILVVFFSCKTKPVVTSTTTAKADRIIQFGEGGGFTGMYEEFQLLETGELKYLDSKTERWILKKNFSDTQTKSFFNQLDEADIKGVDFNKPGNMSSYIELKTNGTTYRVTWGSPSAFPPQKIVDIFNLLMKEAKKSKKV